jgi:CPA2 family monovalent cation:H+ antiporter-2
LILAGALISIVLNPVVFLLVDMARPHLEGRRPEPHSEPIGAAAEEPTLAATADAVVAETAPTEVVATIEEGRPVPSGKTGHVVLVGFGRVGSVVAEGLLRDGRDFVVIEDADDRVAKARALGIEVVVGNAASADVLALASVAAAGTLMIAVPNAFEAGTVVEFGHRANPALHIIARSHSDEEEDYLRRLGVDAVILGEREIGLGMLDWLQRADSGRTVEPEPSAAAPA